MVGSGVGALTPLPLGSVTLLPSPHRTRFEVNTTYVRSLQTANLLQNHYFEAGIWGPNRKPGDDIHWGWESPTSLVRSHFVGHWMSAAARIGVALDDQVLLARANAVVDELARCQEENGGEWVAGIPEKYMERIARGRSNWASQYVVSKSLFGLMEMHTIAGNERALEVLVNAARWFERWTSRFSRDEMDDILDYETCSMFEVLTDLFAITGDPAHERLMRAYDRRRFFDRIRKGEDLLTNRHANTTIPEVCGAARAWEVTGEDRYREVVEQYWRLAVTDREPFATGGQTAAESWTPPGRLATRLGDTNQEHCTVWNMIRLATYLLRWTGDPVYADYIERNIHNGLMAQQHPGTGMVTYYLPMRAGGSKTWGTPTASFWCCYGTLVEANSRHTEGVWFTDPDGTLTLAQYVPSSVTHRGTTVRLHDGPPRRTVASGQADLEADEGSGRPNEWRFHITTEGPGGFDIRLRLPWWLAGQATVNGKSVKGDGWATVRLEGEMDISLPKEIREIPLPDRPSMRAFVDGPVVLAGITDSATRITEPLDPDDERAPTGWTRTWSANDVRFKPLNEVLDESYTIYFHRP